MLARTIDLGVAALVLGRDIGHLGSNLDQLFLAVVRLADDALSCSGSRSLTTTRGTLKIAAAIRPATKFTSSESVVATTRLASAAPARRSVLAVAPEAGPGRPDAGRAAS